MKRIRYKGTGSYSSDGIRFDGEGSERIVSEEVAKRILGSGASAKDFEWISANVTAQSPDDLNNAARGVIEQMCEALNLSYFVVRWTVSHVDFLIEERQGLADMRKVALGVKTLSVDIDGQTLRLTAGLALPQYIGQELIRRLVACGLPVDTTLEAAQPTTTTPSPNVTADGQAASATIAANTDVHSAGAGAEINNVRIDKVESLTINNLSTTAGANVTDGRQATQETNLQLGVAGRPHDEAYDEAARKITGGEDCREVFKRFCSDQKIIKPDKSARNAFKQAMKRRNVPREKLTTTK